MSHHDDELPTLDLATLEQVTGGAADAMSTMLPMMMMMRSRQAAAAPPPAPAQPVMPKILVNGVEQAATSGTPITTTI